MKNRILSLLITIICLFMFSTNTFSQFEQKYTLQASWGVLKPTGYMYDYLKPGFTFDAGAQFNLSRSFAIVGLAKFGKLSAKDNTSDVEFSSLGISLCPKYRFMPESKFNPYVLGGVGLFFASFQIPGNKMKFPSSFGYTVGAGIDITLTDNLAIFLQSGYNSSVLEEKDFNFKENFNNIYVQFGINFSFLKSKSL